MLGQIGGVQVDLPPREMLGRFDQPGNPEAILAWMREPGRLEEYDAAIVSFDMVMFGGLIASRSSATPYEVARRRLYSLWALRQDHKDTDFYGFSTIMRLAPTATRETASWRLLLARYAEVKELVKRRPSKEARNSLRVLESRLPSWEIERYEFTRRRNVRLADDVVQLTGLRAFRHVAFGQDDAAPMGPHLTEGERIAKMVRDNQAGSFVSFLQGIDQVSSVLLARAVLDRSGTRLTVRPDYSDGLARSRVALYESAPIETSFRQQVETAGAVMDNFRGDIVLGINTPNATPEQVSALMGRLSTRSRMGSPAALADINLGKTGTPDVRVVEALSQEGFLARLVGFAGWNTAANTMGTVVPAALIHEAARRAGVSPLERGLQMRRFMLHRLISDWEYHRFTRPLAYRMIDQILRASREELEPQQLMAVDGFVREDLGNRARAAFEQVLLGDVFPAEQGMVRVSNMKNLTIRLPWPRAYEVDVDFLLGTDPSG
jgi:hypothetical protein